ncbi:hypothetical protein PPTG_23286 [Phytophthora nicotianae INRA-310]|uniref:Uncharacterized protein n=1 Tax=Phytophthora nicotianae (strain INRA-310) TaxID=761204 RepID=W2Q134_PHYN3|nr:hypothetical protein PPTG_23286 [Phytophthora nicotianae INRA-310]ETN06903.1 hypothetical protein PPTG_23286 [Phytophthora nicotianae INRA-310]
MDIGQVSTVELLLFTDASFANDPVDRKIISGNHSDKAVTLVSDGFYQLSHVQTYIIPA